MKLSRPARILLALATAVAAGCDASPPPSASPPASTDASAATSATDRWLGRWTGPEGTYLLLEGGSGRYTVTVANLDGPRRFEGVTAGDGIRFLRDGATLTLHATDGAATGMKWLAGKSNCLTVQTGEGYCRD